MPGLGQRVQDAIPLANAALTWIREPRYDTFITPAAGLGVGVVSFFTVPSGTIGSGFAVAKSISETNMNTASQLGTPNQFLIHGFLVQAMVSADGAALNSLQDFLAIYNTGVFRYITGNNTQLEVPLSIIPAGPGIAGFGSSATGGTPLAQAGITNGVPMISHFYDFRTEDGLPTLLGGDQPFRCELGYAGVAGNLITSAACRIKCFLLGIYGKQM